MSSHDEHILHHNLSLDAALSWLKAQEVHPLEAIKTIRRCFRIDLAQAKLALTRHAAWQDETERMRELDAVVDDALKGP